MVYLLAGLLLLTFSNMAQEGTTESNLRDFQRRSFLHIDCGPTIHWAEFTSVAMMLGVKI